MSVKGPVEGSSSLVHRAVGRTPRAAVCGTSCDTCVATIRACPLEARHRAHGRVEDRIKNLKQTGIGRFPSREFGINQTWLQLALTAADLISWTQTTLLHGHLAKAKLKLLRYRLLHVAARLAHGQTPHQDQNRHRLALGGPARPSLPPPRRGSGRRWSADQPCP